MPTIETFVAALVDAFTDGGYGTGWEDLVEIGAVLREAKSPEAFISTLRGETSQRWAEWAGTLGLPRPTPEEIETILTEVGDILAPYADIPVTTIIGYSVERDHAARRFVDGAPPRSRIAVGKRQPIERDADQNAFIDALLRDGFRFDMTYAEWVSADRNVIGRMSWDENSVWLHAPLPSTERLRYTPRPPATEYGGSM